jgi:hypothetical protein
MRGEQGEGGDVARTGSKFKAERKFLSVTEVHALTSVQKIMFYD